MAACCVGAAASESDVVGPRALGMGGAGVAATDDGVAQFYNPAAFGFFSYPARGGDKVASDNNDLHRKTWGLELDATGGGRQGDTLAGRISELNDLDTTTLRATSITSAAGLVNLSKFGNAFIHTDDPGNSLTMYGNAGGTARVWRFGLGVRTFAEFYGSVPHVDLAHVGLPAGGAPNFETAVNATGATTDGTTRLFDPNMLGAGAAQQQATQRLDFAARQAGVSAGDAAELQTLYQAMQAQFGADTFKDNTTAVVVHGLAVTEVPVTYGHPIDEHLSVGGNVKLMLGRVYAQSVSIFDGTATDQIRHARDDYESSATIGIDLGVLWRTRLVQVGVTGRDLNKPSFAGPTVNGVAYDDVHIDRQVTIGAAFIPFSTLVVESDLDLLKAHALAPDYDVRDVRLGVEWNPKHIVALRAGLSRNLAEHDVGTMVHAGVGLNLWAVRIDLAGAASTRKTDVNGTAYPREAQASFGIATEF